MDQEQFNQKPQQPEWVHAINQLGMMLQVLIQNRENTTTTGPSFQVTPPFFYGKEKENVMTWVFQVEEIFNARHINEADRIHYAAGLLKDAALQWYHNMIRNIREGRRPPLKDWNELVKELEYAFQPPHQQQLLRRQLRQLKQTSTVQEYVYRFRNLLGQVTEMSEMDRITYFIEGLKGQTKAKVNYKAPATLEEAIHIAVTYDTAMFDRPSRMETKPNMRRDNNQYKNYSESTNTTYMDLSVLDTRKNKDELKQKGLCYSCKKHGHRFYECPTKNHQGKDKGQLKGDRQLSKE
jgi:hypothetical protein